MRKETEENERQHSVIIQESPVKATKRDVAVIDLDPPPAKKFHFLETDSDLAGSSDNESISLSSETDSEEYSSHKKTKLTPDIWENIPIRKTDCLPPDIDGLAAYELPFEKDDPMASSKDGRKWQRFMTSSRANFDGIRRLAQCAGSSVCNNTSCSFRKQWGPNYSHFTKSNSCKFCGKAAEFVPCQARKIWEFNSDRGTVTVYHYGQHTCPVVVKPN